MPTRMEKDYIFEAGIYIEDSFVINVFEMTLCMEVESENMYEQNIAIDRMNHIIYNAFQNCIFINEKEKEKIETFTNAGFRVCPLFDDPYDQIIASTIMIKIHTILENKLSVEQIVFGSKITGGIRFSIELEELPNTLFSKNWWTEPNSKINNFEAKENNVVALFLDDWISLDLGWKEKKSLTS